jgi:cyclophilin family peptidyl-prolyl cis-trans isomerase
MSKYIFKILILLFFLINNTMAEDNLMILKLKDGDVKIELFPDVAPKHVERIKKLADEGKYDNVVFHRVIDSFMAQTGDVQFGNFSSDNYDLNRAGTGGSSLSDLVAEFNDFPHDRGTLSMARSQDPNSANSQFFICFKPAPFLDRQYTVFGKVIEGMKYVDKIKRGDEKQNGSVKNPDKIISFKTL